MKQQIRDSHRNANIARETDGTAGRWAPVHNSSAVKLLARWARR